MGLVWGSERFAGNVVALDDRGRSLTYGELDAVGRELAAAVGGRCLVFVLCRNEVGSLLGYAGFMDNGVVPLMLSADIDGVLLDRLIGTYHPSFLWVPADMRDAFPCMGIAYEACGYALLRTWAESPVLHRDLCLLLTTSGSTGSPKLVRQSYENVRSNAESIAEYLGLDETERPITTLPMNYTYGLSVINSHLLVGASILVTDRGLMQREFWEFFGKEGATSFGGVPYTYEMLDKLRFYRRNLPSLRTMTQAGGKILPELHERFARYAEETGRRFVVMYGQCEATARMGWLPPERTLEKRGSMGVAIPGGSFRLVGDDGSEVTEPWVTGELVYEGPNVTLGYAERAVDLAAGDERHGVLETGDMAQRDEEGFYYIVGRRKRFLKVYGNRVSLDELERMVRSELGLEVACSGTDDHVWLFVTDGSAADVVRDLVAVRTRLNPVAFRVAVIDAIPKNEAGKILYRELAGLIEE